MIENGGGNLSENKVKRKRLPVFSILLVACFIIASVVFFIYGMAESPGRVFPSPESDPSVINNSDDPVPSTEQIPSPSPEPTAPPLPPPVIVKGIWVRAYSSSNKEIMDKLIELVSDDNTILNTIVLDAKNENGRVIHLSNNEFSHWRPSRESDVIQDHTELVTELKELGIYTIARIACFKDPIGALRQPQNAIHDNQGNMWVDSEGKRWLNPYIRDNWDYIAEIGLEAAKMGFEEIQLDFVRFPVQGPGVLGLTFGQSGEEVQSKAEVIAEFAGFIRDTMHMVGVRVSADIFAIAGVSTSDSGHLGQDVSLLLPQLDAISPMIYPSHFANERQNEIGSFINGVLFPRPALEPHGVVFNTLEHYRRHLEQFNEEYPGVPAALIRPYLQGSNDNYLGEGFWMPYGPDEYLAQIQAVYDAGFEEWIFWNHISDYFTQDRAEAFIKP
jgi:hypothetical protein